MTPPRASTIALLLPVLLLALAGCTEKSAPPFDEARAFKDLATQVAFGPRVPGTPAHDRCRDWIAAELAKTGVTPVLQSFADTVYGQAYAFTNVRARYGPHTGPWIVLGAHWDTRAIADNDPDPAKRSQPIPGANDGASGVAVLLEIARAFQAEAPPIGVELVFFDGEDLGRGGDVRGFSRGSKHYVGALEHPRPALAIVLDMVGDKDLGLYYEVNSHQAARNLVDRLWAGAARVQAPGFIPEERHNVYDDHAPFLEAGIPGIDVIDFDYKAWHTTGDDLTQVSAGSLGQVGRTVLRYVYTSEPEAGPGR
ncbi:MAG: M28 family peptidase [Candidatus Eisenbacteria bacterium]